MPNFDFIEEQKRFVRLRVEADNYQDAHDAWQAGEMVEVSRSNIESELYCVEDEEGRQIAGPDGRLVVTRDATYTYDPDTGDITVDRNGVVMLVHKPTSSLYEKVLEGAFGQLWIGVGHAEPECENAAS